MTVRIRHREILWRRRIKKVNLVSYLNILAKESQSEAVRLLKQQRFEDSAHFSGKATAITQLIKELDEGHTPRREYIVS